MTSWKLELDKSQLILLCTPGANRGIFIGESAPFSKADTRLRTIPLTTRRPTLVEIKRIHQILSSVEFFKADPLPTTAPIEEKLPIVSEVVKDKNDDKVGKEEVEEVPYMELTVDLMSIAIKEGDLKTVKQLIEEDYVRLPEAESPLFLAVQQANLDIIKFLIEVKVKLDIPSLSWNFYTSLHKAAHDGNVEVLLVLLNAGADPTIKGLDGKTAYDLSKNKIIRDTFRKFAGEHSTRWNWMVAGIQQLTKEM